MAISVLNTEQEDPRQYDSIQIVDTPADPFYDFFQDAEFQRSKFSHSGKEAQEKVRRALKYYQNTDLTLKEIANSAGVSEYQLKKILTIAERTQTQDLVRRSVVQKLAPELLLKYKSDDWNKFQSQYTDEHKLNPEQIEYIVNYGESRLSQDDRKFKRHIAELSDTLKVQGDYINQVRTAKRGLEGRVIDTYQHSNIPVEQIAKQNSLTEKEVYNIINHSNVTKRKDIEKYGLELLATIQSGTSQDTEAALPQHYTENQTINLVERTQDTLKSGNYVLNQRFNKLKNKYATKNQPTTETVVNKPNQLTTPSSTQSKRNQPTTIPEYSLHQAKNNLENNYLQALDQINQLSDRQHASIEQYLQTLPKSLEETKERPEYTIYNHPVSKPRPTIYFKPSLSRHEKKSQKEPELRTKYLPGFEPRFLSKEWAQELVEDYAFAIKHPIKLVTEYIGAVKDDRKEAAELKAHNKRTKFIPGYEPPMLSRRYWENLSDTIKDYTKSPAPYLAAATLSLMLYTNHVNKQTSLFERDQAQINRKVNIQDDLHVLKDLYNPRSLEEPNKENSTPERNILNQNNL